MPTQQMDEGFGHTVKDDKAEHERRFHALRPRGEPSMLLAKAPLEGSTQLSRLTAVAPAHAVLIVLACTCITYWIGLAVVNLDRTRGHAIGSDGLFYYEYLPSLVIDGDLDFKNQREVLIREGVPYNWSAMTKLSPGTGLQGTFFTVGWSVLCSPFFLAAHALAHLTGGRTDGYGMLYESFTAFGALVWGCIGVWILYLIQRRFVSDWLAALVAIGALAATNLDYYIIAQASMSHAPAFFTICLAFYCLIDGVSLRDDAKHGWLFGLAAGLAFLVRPQLALCVGPMFLFAAARGVGRWWLVAAAFTGAAVGCIQLLVWRRLFGSYLAVPHGQSFFNFDQPAVFEVLFSRRHGLFVWHPAYLVCLFGLFLPKRYVEYRWLSLACIALQVYVNASTSDWWAGNAFGNRRFIEMLPLFSMGATGLIRWVRSPTWTFGIVAAFAVWNSLFMIQYRFGYIPRGDEVTWQQLTVDKLRLPFIERPYQ